MGFVWCLTFRLVEVESRVWNTPDRVAVTYPGPTKLVIWVKLLLSNPGHVIDANPKNDHRRLTVVNRN